MKNNKARKLRLQVRLKGRGKRNHNGVTPQRGKGTSTHGHR